MADVEQVVASGATAALADHALVFGGAGPGCGIPTSGSRRWTPTGSGSSAPGAAPVGGATSSWRSTSAAGGSCWSDRGCGLRRLRPGRRILPGGRYAYDKGGDPKELVLSTDWERWKRQTAAHFAHFDLGVLPVGEGRPLGAVYVAADSPVWQAIDRGWGGLGYQVVTPSTPTSRGTWPVAQGRGPDRHLRRGPARAAGVRSRQVPAPLSGGVAAPAGGGVEGVLRQRLGDGTRLILIYGEDVEAVLEIVEDFELELDH